MVTIEVGRLQEAMPDDDGHHQLAGLYRQEYRSLVRLASVLLDDRDACEEVVQDAFVTALVRWRTIRDPERAPAFLRSVVLNSARSRLRRRAVARRHPEPPPGATGSPEDATVATRAVVDALRGLPPRQRECVVLRYYLGLTDAEIAATLGVSAGSVKTHLSRGRAALARRLGADR